MADSTKIGRFTTVDGPHAWNGGTTTHIPCLFYKFTSRIGHAGHVRLFGKPLRGLMIHHWNRTTPEWALTRAWHFFGLVTVIHIEPGEHLKRCNPAGWHFRFASIRFVRFHAGVGVEFRKADRGYSA